MVRNTLKGIKRTVGTAPVQKLAALTEDIRAMLEAADADLIGLRDRALILLGFASAFRRAELVGLDLAQLDFNRDGLTVTLRRSKTDQEGQGRKIGVKYDPGAAPNPTSRTTDPLWWFKFDVNQWCADQHIMSMTDYQRGWYISLLAACWKTAGYLPSDPDKLARIARADDLDKFKMELGEILWAFDVAEDGVQIVHLRLNADWNEKVAGMEQCSNAGKKSAASRAKKAQKEAA